MSKSRCFQSGWRIGSARIICRLVAPCLTLLACGALYWAYQALDRPSGTVFEDLQGTLFWDLRWIALGCAFVALLTIVERLATWIASIGNKRGTN